LIFAYSIIVIGWTPDDDAKVFGEIYWEENDVILLRKSRGWDLFKNDLKKEKNWERMIPCRLYCYPKSLV